MSNGDPVPLASKNESPVVFNLRQIAASGIARWDIRNHIAAAADEIERLARERDQLLTAIGEHVTVRSDQYALIQRLTKDRDLWKERHDRERAAHAKNLTEQQKVEAERDRLRAALNGEPAPVRKMSNADVDRVYGAAAVKRAYYETHEPPHCPTCDCGVPDGICTCRDVLVVNGRCTQCRRPIRASEKASGELEQLRRIDRAARRFVEFLDTCAPQGGVWTDHVPTDLLDALQPLELALFDGRASENGSERQENER